DDAAFQLERRISGVFRSNRIRLPGFVPPARNMRCAKARDCFDAAEQVIENVAPVAQHVDNDSAAVLLTVVPGRPLPWNYVALEHPIAELAANREDIPKETKIAQRLQLQQTREPELVLHHAVLHAGGVGSAIQIVRSFERVG